MGRHTQPVSETSVNRRSIEELMAQPEAHNAALSESTVSSEKNTDNTDNKKHRHAERLRHKRASNKGAKNRRARKISVGTIIWRLFWLLILAVLGGCVLLYFTTKVPTPDSLPLPKPVTVYFSDGTTEMGSFGQASRTLVDLSDIAEPMQQAVVASQDPDFNESPALSITDVPTKLWESAWGGQSDGGSSLTQNYADIVQRSSSGGLFSGIQNFFLPIRIDSTLTKDEILENYLNTAYFGRGAYGVEAAAHTYFGITAKDLTLPQAALLTAIMPAPSSWDPAVDPDQAKKRYAQVLTSMVSANVIDQAQADEAAFPTIQPVLPSESMTGTNGYLLAMVRSELISQARISPETVDRGELRVVSTIDAATQEAAVNAVAVAADGRPEGVQTGLFAMDSASGAVVAVYGGADYAARATNNATVQRIPAGAPYKAVALAQNFESGESVDATYYHFETGYVDTVAFPDNPSYPYRIMSLIEATQLNINDIFVRMGGVVGLEKIKEQAIKMGIPADAPGLNANIDSPLGRVQVTAKEMARLYGAFANKGKIVEPHIIQTVINAQGSEIYSASAVTTQVMSEDSAALTTHMLQLPFTDGGAAHGNGQAIAGTRSVAGMPSSGVDTQGAWFVGYTPNLVAAVTMFHPDGQGGLAELQEYAGQSGISGNAHALRVWAAFMEPASAGRTPEAFPDSQELVASRTSGGNIVQPSQQ